MNFEVNLIFLIKRFFLHDQKVVTNTNIPWERKDLLRWNKKTFFITSKGLSIKQITFGRIESDFTVTSNSLRTKATIGGVDKSWLGFVLLICPVLAKSLKKVCDYGHILMSKDLLQIIKKLKNLVLRYIEIHRVLHVVSPTVSWYSLDLTVIYLVKNRHKFFWKILFLNYELLIVQWRPFQNCF